MAAVLLAIQLAPAQAFALERFTFRADTQSRGIASGVVHAYLWLPRDDHRKHPLIVLSHGSGGSALGMSWIPSALVRAGYAVAAVDHPGNTSTEPYTPQGFMLWWLRAREISMLLDRIFANESLRNRSMHRA